VKVKEPEQVAVLQICARVRDVRWPVVEGVQDWEHCRLGNWNIFEERVSTAC
jgi:hypothetical protein